MKKPIYWILTLFFSFLFFSLIVQSAEKSAEKSVEKSADKLSDKSEGDRPYTPTRLEWLIVSARGECAALLNGIPHLTWRLQTLLGSKDTVSLQVRMTDEKVKSEAEAGAQACERHILAFAKEKGWGWAKVSLDIGNRDTSKNLAGFQLLSVETGSVFERLKLKQHDIIRTINGKPVNSQSDAMALADLLKTADKIVIEIVREGVLQKLTYQLK